MQILLINPNTSRFVTDRMAAAASRVLEGIATVTGVTADDGPAIVADRNGHLKAAGSTVKLGLLHAAAFDAVIVGISTDAGLATLRAALKQPVVGMLESAVITACQRGRRIGLMTLGPQMLPLYQEQVARYGLAGKVAAWTAPVLPQAYTATPGHDVDEALTAHASSMIRQHRLDTLIFCGAVLAGCRPRISPKLSVPLIDATEAAALQALALARQL